MKFDWDKNKDRNNQRKHGVSFEEAKSIFYDFLSITIDDPFHSIGEERYITIGKSYSERILIVSHTDKNETIRIINARVANKKERKNYEEE